MTNHEIEHITFWLMIKWAVIFYIITIPFKIWAQNRALKKIKTMLQEDEEIIYKPKFDYIIELILPLATGAFFGGFILPFYLYPEIQNIMLLNRGNLFIAIIGEIICFLVALMGACSRCIITNKRILRISSFDFINNITKILNLNLDDINSLELVKSYGIESINIIKQNDEFCYFSGFKNMKKIKSIIEEQINM